LFRRRRVLIWFLSIFILSIFSLSVQARRIKREFYYLEEYDVLGTTLSKPRVNFRYSFPFPVSISEHHVSAYLWVKKLIEKGRLPQGLSLIYLDAHLDHFIGKTWTVQSSNWVRAVLDEELCSSASLILPDWVYEDINRVYRIKLYDAVEEIHRLYKHQLSIFELQDLPAGKDLGPVVLSIDCDYFSNMGYPEHRVSPREIEQEIARVIKTLEDKGIKIAALNIAISPGYTWLDQEIFIEEKLLQAFSEYGRK